MSTVDLILQKLHLLNRAESEKVQRALRKHLEKLEEQADIAAYDKARARKEKTESLSTMLTRYAGR